MKGVSFPSFTLLCCSSKTLQAKVEPCAHILKHYKRPIFQSCSDLLITPGDTLVQSFALCPHTKAAGLIPTPGSLWNLVCSPPPPSLLHIIVLVLMSLFNHTDECLYVSSCSAGRPAKPQWLNTTYASIFFSLSEQFLLGMHGFSVLTQYCINFFTHCRLRNCVLSCIPLKKKQATRTSTTGCGT